MTKRLLIIAALLAVAGCSLWAGDTGISAFLTTPGGSNGSVQYNEDYLFAGTTDFTYIRASRILSVPILYATDTTTFSVKASSGIWMQAGVLKWPDGTVSTTSIPSFASLLAATNTWSGGNTLSSWTVFGGSITLSNATEVGLGASTQFVNNPLQSVEAIYALEASTFSIVTSSGIKIESYGIRWPDGTVQISSPTALGGVGDAVLSATQTWTGSNTFSGTFTVTGSSLTFGTTASTVTVRGSSITVSGNMAILGTSGSSLRVRPDGTNGLVVSSRTIEAVTSGGATIKLYDDPSNSEMLTAQIIVSSLSIVDPGSNNRGLFYSWAALTDEKSQMIVLVDTVTLAVPSGPSLSVISGGVVSQGQFQAAESSTFSIVSSSGINILAGGIRWPDGTVQVSSPVAGGGGGSGDAVLSATQTWSGGNKFNSWTTLGGSVTANGHISVAAGKSLAIGGASVGTSEGILLQTTGGSVSGYIRTKNTSASSGEVNGLVFSNNLGTLLTLDVFSSGAPSTIANRARFVLEDRTDADLEFQTVGAHPITFKTGAVERFRADENGNGINFTAVTTTPTASATQAFLWPVSVGGSAELKVMDGGGSITQISPHRGDEWIFESVNQFTGKRVYFEMEKLMPILAAMAGHPEWAVIETLVPEAPQGEIDKKLAEVAGNPEMAGFAERMRASRELASPGLWPITSHVGVDKSSNTGEGN